MENKLAAVKDIVAPMVELTNNQTTNSQKNLML